MKRKQMCIFRFNKSQIVKVLNEFEGGRTNVVVCCEYGAMELAYYSSLSRDCIVALDGMPEQKTDVGTRFRVPSGASLLAPRPQASAVSCFIQPPLVRAAGGVAGFLQRLRRQVVYRWVMIGVQWPTSYRLRPLLISRLAWLCRRLIKFGQMKSIGNQWILA